MSDENEQMEEIYNNFENSEAVLTGDEVNRIEERWGGRAGGISRRSGLASLARSGKELLENIGTDRGAAVALATVSELTKSYAEDLRLLADLMDHASIRTRLALVNREDMEAVISEAKSSIS